MRKLRDANEIKALTGSWLVKGPFLPAVGARGTGQRLRPLQAIRNLTVPQPFTPSQLVLPDHVPGQAGTTTPWDRPCPSYEDAKGDTSLWRGFNSDQVVRTIRSTAARRTVSAWKAGASTSLSWRRRAPKKDCKSQKGPCDGIGPSQAAEAGMWARGFHASDGRRYHWKSVASGYKGAQNVTIRNFMCSVCIQRFAYHQ